MVKNDNFVQNPGLGQIFRKIDIFILDMSAMVKKAILSKILDWATCIGKNEIFSLDMSAVIKNDSFWSHVLEKLKF